MNCPICNTECASLHNSSNFNSFRCLEECFVYSLDDDKTINWFHLRFPSNKIYYEVRVWKKSLFIKNNVTEVYQKMATHMFAHLYSNDTFTDPYDAIILVEKLAKVKAFL